MSRLSFIFTEDSFRVDKPEEDCGEQEELKNSFIENRYKALFQMGFQGKRREMSPSFRFLYMIAESFVRALFDHPEIEVAREWTKIDLSDEGYRL